MEERNQSLESTAIRIDRLAVDFSGRAVLRDLSFDIPVGGPTFILGRSGSGKTTLLRAINRLNECLPGCTTRGNVRLNLNEGWVDAYAPETKADVLRRQIGMVFQSPNVLPLSIERNIQMPLEVVLSLPKDEIRARVEQSLRDVHLWDEVKARLSTPAATLSGGQQQRLCLARALALAPEILLLDEPTASLDFKAAQQIEALISELGARYTLVVVSHNLGQTQRLARHAFILHDGCRIESLSPQVFGDKNLLLETMDELL